MEVLPFRPMSATSEVPAAFRHAAGDRGALRLIREAISDIRSRRRLVRYLVQADIRKRGADTLLGNIWWVLDPLLQMVVYVVFVTIIVPRPTPDYPLFIFAAILPWKWFTATITRLDLVDRRQGPADQADPVPQDRAADRGACGRRSSASRSVSSALGLLMLFYPRPDHALPAADPGDRGRPVRVHAGLQLPRRGGQRLLPRSRQRRVAPPAPVVVPVARACIASRSLDELNIFKEHPALRTIVRLNPFAILFEAYRKVIYGIGDTEEPPGLPDFASLGVAARRSVILLAFTTYVFKRLEPNFAKVI